MGGSCPYSFWPYLKNGRKLCLPILTIFEKWEEIVPTPFRTLLKNGRKLSLLHSNHFWKLGGNCPYSILTIFEKWEEIVPT
jgi:hypothetical protein